MTDTSQVRPERVASAAGPAVGHALYSPADGPCLGRERVQMIIDADGPWTSAARLVVDREHRGQEHGVTNDGGTLCGLSPDLIDVYRHPFNGRGRTNCRTCARRLYELAGLAGQEPPLAPRAGPLLRWTAWVTNGADAVMVTAALRQVLTGRAITAVRYADLDREHEVPYWHEGDRDVVGHGLELDLDDGSTWSVIWEQQGDSAGLGIRAEPLMPDHLRLPGSGTSLATGAGAVRARSLRSRPSGGPSDRRETAARSAR